MDKEFCIWLKDSNKAQFFNKPEALATYDQMISDGWKPKAQGEATIVFEKDVCNSETNVHTDTN